MASRTTMTLLVLAVIFTVGALTWPGGPTVNTLGADRKAAVRGGCVIDCNLVCENQPKFCANSNCNGNVCKLDVDIVDNDIKATYPATTSAGNGLDSTANTWVVCETDYWCPATCHFDNLLGWVCDKGLLPGQDDQFVSSRATGGECHTSGDGGAITRARDANGWLFY